MNGRVWEGGDVGEAECVPSSRPCLNVVVVLIFKFVTSSRASLTDFSSALLLAVLVWQFSVW